MRDNSEKSAGELSISSKAGQGNNPSDFLWLLIIGFRSTINSGGFNLADKSENKGLQLTGLI